MLSRHNYSRRNWSRQNGSRWNRSRWTRHKAVCSSVAQKHIKTDQQTLVSYSTITTVVGSVTFLCQIVVYQRHSQNTANDRAHHGHTLAKSSVLNAKQPGASFPRKVWNIWAYQVDTTHWVHQRLTRVFYKGHWKWNWLYLRWHTCMQHEKQTVWEKQSPFLMKRITSEAILLSGRLRSMKQLKSLVLHIKLWATYLPVGYQNSYGLPDYLNWFGDLWLAYQK